MEITRKIKLNKDFSELIVGDQFEIEALGKRFTATCHDIRDGEALIVFDEYVIDLPMNENGKNIGGFEESDLKDWLNSKFYSTLDAEIKGRVSGDIRILTVEEVFGRDDYYEAADYEQLPLMKERKNRLAFIRDKDGDETWDWGWLMNRVKDSASDFAAVNSNGRANYTGASYSGGVRPAFYIRLKSADQTI
ncbi:MAG: hypothetical protein J6M92_02290 [Oribacterium sp.]|nr:hypothetical protein [Oribacterium sp.]